MADHDLEFVCAVADVPPGGRKILKVRGREVGVFNVDGRFYALKNVCVHQGARVCLGKVSGTTLPSRVYEFKYGQEGRVLRCPWHGWEYNVTTGESLFDPATRVVAYPVTVRDGAVYVAVGERIGP